MTGATAGPRSVGLCHSPQWRYLTLEILREIKRRYGCAIHVYVFGKAGRDFYEKAAEPGLVDSISIRSLISDGAQNRAVGDVAAALDTARRIERRYETTYNEVMMTDRHIGRGFSLLAPAFPRSRQSNSTTYDGVIAKFNEDFAFWEAEFDRKRFDLFLFPQKIPSMVARARGVPTRGLISSRIRDLHHWYRDGEFFSLPEVGKVAESIANPPPVEHKAYTQLSINSAAALENLRWRNAALNGIVWTGRYLLQRATGRTAGYNWGGAFTMNFRIAAQWRALKKLKPVGLDALAGQPYIFFPLQSEPEMSISWQSPESLPQHTYIWQIARDLPAGAKLAVKEHLFAIGTRPAEFYRMLCDLKNVVFLDPLIPGPAVIEGASAVATISSTAGFEAAWSGKPVLSLSQHCLYNYLDHVWIPDMEPGGMRRALYEILSGAFDAPKAKLDGARFYKALVDLSFPLGIYNMARPEAFEKLKVGAVVDALARSLSDPVGGVP